MSAFRWSDRHGVDHDLAHYQPIIDEVSAIEAEVDGQLTGLESADRAVRDRARAVIDERRRRLVQLHADILRWNNHAEAETRSAATALAGQIDALSAALKDMRLLVGLHDEHARVLHDSRDAPDRRQAALAGPATPRQMLALTLTHGTMKPQTPTRAEAWAWLISQPRFHRSPVSDGGWFAWIDPAGHSHRLHDPLPIERMGITILVELEAMRDGLRTEQPLDTLFPQVERGLALLDMVNVLKADLERFDREAEARDLAACKAYTADWRSRRTMS